MPKRIEVAAKKTRDFIDAVARTSPARMTLGVFATVITISTFLLWTPWSTQTGTRPPFIDALFVSTSAVCVTGLSTVDTVEYWSRYGQGVIMVSMMVGGLGVVTLASILSLAVSRHIGLTQRILFASEASASRLGEVGALVRAVLVASLGVESVWFVSLFIHFQMQGQATGEAAFDAAFMAASFFNNAGFSVLPEGLERYVGDWGMTIPLVMGTSMGAIGFPVLLDVIPKWRSPRKWSLHSKLTITFFLSLSALGAFGVWVLERNNPQTFGGLTWNEAIQAALVSGFNAHTLGLSTVSVENMDSATWLLQDAIMFVGGGSASTAGGIKVTTLAVLIFAIVAEARGDRDIEAFGRRIPPSTLRLAVSVALMGALLVGVATLFLLIITPFSLDQVLYEVVSAFSTTGLSTGKTSQFPTAGKAVLVALMFLGRTGSMTLAAALALRDRRRIVRMPEEAPLIG
ncbi:MAG: potassium transporter TrkG [Buchananella hordeovulneris]|nr:potassium transporter TrkG [Buchananella hordeovulneris]